MPSNTTFTEPISIEALPLKETGILHPMVLAALEKEGPFAQYNHLHPSLDELVERARQRPFSQQQRDVLVSVLKEQYQGLEILGPVSENVHSLSRPNTYTIATGHQLHVAGGPLYVLYKLCSIVSLVQRVNAKQQEIRFVPVFWLASEDHDFDEIKSVRLFNQTYTWEREHNNEPVGALTLETLQLVVDGLAGRLPGNAGWLRELVQESYKPEYTLTEATRRFFNALFGQHGLVVLDAADARLKKQFASIVQDELTNQSGHQQSQPWLKELQGYKLPVSPREINLFYFNRASRERIVETGEGFATAGNSKSWKKEEILRESAANPERFSPNVMLRPVYQEVVLPNVAYIGGTNEIAYWLQLKPLFEHWQVPHPAVYLRDSAALLGQKMADDIEKLGLTPAQMASKSVAELESLFFAQQSQNPAEEIVARWQGEAEGLRAALNQFPRPQAAVLVKQLNEVAKNVSDLKKQIKKAQEQEFSTQLEKLRKLHTRLNPDGKPQERADYLIGWLASQGAGLVGQLIDAFAPEKAALKVAVLP